MFWKKRGLFSSNHRFSPANAFAALGIIMAAISLAKMLLDLSSLPLTVFFIICLRRMSSYFTLCLMCFSSGYHSKFRPTSRISYNLCFDGRRGTESQMARIADDAGMHKVLIMWSRNFPNSPYRRWKVVYRSTLIALEATLLWPLWIYNTAFLSHIWCVIGGRTPRCQFHSQISVLVHPPTVGMVAEQSMLEI